MNRLRYVKNNDIYKLHYDFGNDKCALIIGCNQRAEPVHIHDFYELVVISGGAAVHIIDDEKYPVIRGDVFVVRGDHRHGFDNTKELSLVNFLFRRDYFEELKKEFGHLPGFNALFVNEPLYRKNQKFKSKLHLSTRQFREVSQLLNSMKKEQEESRPGFSEAIERNFELLIINVCRYYSDVETPNSKALLRISTAIDFMENNFGQPVSISLLAKKTYMSESNFRHTFKKITGLSPIDFLIRLRIEKATEFMADTPGVNVTETSIRTGFENSAYFSKKFKEIIGITPMAYLKKQRELTEI